MNSSKYLINKHQYRSHAYLAFIVAVVMLLQAVCANGAESKSLIERGQYLARAGNCAACHTAGNGESYAGGVAFETPFGTIYSTNITPDPETGIGNWTGEEFRQALREGVRPDGENLYPVFPYTAFTKITDEDIAALFVYLKSVPSVRSQAPENDLSFPYNQRWLMSVWNALYFDEGAYEPDDTKSAEWNRGAYLVEALAHCSACHSPRNFLGAVDADMAMTGGTYLDEVPGGVVRPWSAPNLTSAPNGLAIWSKKDVVAYLKTGRNSFLVAFGPMNKVIMEGTRHLSDTDVRAMAIYLKSLPSNAADFESPADDEVLRAGQTLYNVHCGLCHLPTGLGGNELDLGPRLADGSLVVQANDPASLINVILYGLERPPMPTKRWNHMEAYGDELSDEDVAALASYLRSAWDNVGGEVTADQVATQRSHGR